MKGEFLSPMAGMLLLACAFAGLQSCRMRHSDGVTKTDSSTTSDKLLFVEVTRQAGLAEFRHETGAFGAKWLPETLGGGVAFVDYDGDGWSDVLAVAGSTWPQTDETPVAALRLYHNNRDGTFNEVTEQVGLGDVHAYGFGIAAADYDNDGDEDVFLATLHRDLLFRNEGGRFVEIGRQAGITNSSRWSTAAVFFDADRDGLLDLYVGSYVVWSPEKDEYCTLDGETKAYCQPTLYEGLPGTFYYNLGNGTFEDRTEEAGLDAGPGKTLGAVEFDHNRDGWPDLVVANDAERDLLFENDRDGTFTEKGVLSGIAFDSDGKARGGMGIDAGVVDGTGRETVFVANFSNEMVGVYRYEGEGQFLDRAAASRVGRATLRKVSFGLFLFDPDLDGDLDLFVANGSIWEQADPRNGVPYRQEAQLFLNDGDGYFSLVEPSAEHAFSRPLVGRGAAYADYDGDGDLDVLLISNGGNLHLWRNEHLRGRPADAHDIVSLRVHVEGTESNRDGVGAQVEVLAGQDWMYRRIRTGASYLSQSEKVATFGLGAFGRADSLIVRWPSERVDRFANVIASEIRVVEGEHIYEKLPMKSAATP